MDPGRPNLMEEEEPPYDTEFDPSLAESGSLYSDITQLQITNLPEEVLERILSFLSCYKELDTAKLVCKQWQRVVKSVVKQKKRIFRVSLYSGQVSWTQVIQQNGDNNSHIAISKPPLCISDRFSHSTVYLDCSMYVFGGCTSTNTTFNDLWRFDLTSRQWVRPVAMGAYPSPKACASMVVYNGNLVLFGGWSHPVPYPLHQSAHYFSELHVYNPSSNRWSHVLSIGLEPDTLGGHSASVAGDLMVVFGGSPRPGVGTNKLWVFNFRKGVWLNPGVNVDCQPEPRYGQYQCTLDEKHILIMGGWVGPNKVFNDFYLLTIQSDNPWVWKKLEVKQLDMAAPQTLNHCACKVKDMVVVIAKAAKPRETKNIQPHVIKVDSGKKKKPPEEQNSTPHTTIHATLGRHNILANAADNHSGAGSQDGTVRPLSRENRNLLTLQQRLHRECLNLQEHNSHHHNSHLHDDVPESHVHRIQNRVSGQQQEQADHQGDPQAVPNPLPQQQEQQQQPAENSPPSPRPQSQPGRAGASAMPSIRPNASNNRQKQLEALQRQEELLRSKSKALAAARDKRQAWGPAVSQKEVVVSVDEVPETVMTKNKMDVYVVDISRVLTDGEVEWKPLSQLQPPGAPTVTICSSLIEGRGELVLFGGVVREMSSPTATNVATNKLYLLHS